MARLAVLELTVLTFERKSAVEQVSQFPCTYPGCARGLDHPFETSGQLGNHRLAAHGIRSTNEESIRRQERRDRLRAKELGAAPEYIDGSAIRARVSRLLPVPSGCEPGPLSPGERERARRRLSHFIGIALPREIRRAPAEICVAIAEIAASALAPQYSPVPDSARADIQTERITQLFTKAPTVAC